MPVCMSHTFICVSHFLFSVFATNQALGDAGEQLCELEAVQLSRLWKALLLLRDDGVALPESVVEVRRMS